MILIHKKDVLTEVHLHAPAWSCFVSEFMPTYLVSDSEGSVKAIVLDDGAASLRRADGADVRHAQSVAGVVAA